MTSNQELQGLRLFVSSSLPSELVGTERAQDLYEILGVLVSSVLSRGGEIVFGGHPTVTPLVHTIALKHHLPAPAIELYQLERFRDVAPEVVEDRAVFGEVRWVPRQGPPDESPDAELRQMRELIAGRSNAAVILGGKTPRDSLTRAMGLREEYEVFLAAHPAGPAYLLGLLDGAASMLIQEHDAAKVREPNGLSDEELRTLHTTGVVDVAAALVLADLERFAATQRPGRAAKARRGSRR